MVEEEEEEEDVVEDEEEQEEEEEGGELTHIRTLCMDLSADGSVFEGLQIIYSPFRRRVLFSFDRFIRWRTRESRTDRPTADRSGLLRPVISRPRTTRAHLYLHVRHFFFRLARRVLTTPSPPPCPSGPVAGAALKNEPGHYFCAPPLFVAPARLTDPVSLSFSLILPPLPLPLPAPRRRHPDVVSAGAACNVPHQRMCKNEES